MTSGRASWTAWVSGNTAETACSAPGNWSVGKNTPQSSTIGVISSVTQAFCRDCTRMRLSTEGKLYTCLFATEGHDLRRLLRSGAADDEIRGVIRAVWSKRADRYSEIRGAASVPLRKIEMSYIGG